MKGCAMKITSPVFSNGGAIPKKYTGDSSDLNPPLHIEGVPDGAKSLALIMDDPDAPGGTFNHWVLFNMDPKTHDIHEGSVPVIATQGSNDFGRVDYGGPKPPSGEHHYFFKMFALDTVLNLARGSSRVELEKAMNRHVLDQASLMGRYARN
ncbi:MAG: YbhB/YbcL family Raf kinase inhibitor-like protein [Verrucomicrobia bacterium]|nr:YbhB/YbcL family Raf kinase inhibitor-like protein [Verrucomicrobiota bacterium]